MKFSIFKYGTGILYGPSSSFTAIAPDRGPSIGGTDFVVFGSGFEYKAFDDDFSGGILDPGKWIDISAGGGSATVSNDLLHLSSGAFAGDVGGVIMNTAGFDHIQYEVKVNIPLVISFPSTSVSLFYFNL